MKIKVVETYIEADARELRESQTLSSELFRTYEPDISVHRTF